MAAVWLGSEHGDDGTVIIRNPVHYGKPVPTTVTKDRSRWLRVKRMQWTFLQAGFLMRIEHLEFQRSEWATWYCKYGVCKRSVFVRDEQYQDPRPINVGRGS